ncbi:ATP-binding SpoIIE family protein phosphatase [Streptomyces sp. LZ34]
MGNMPNDDGAQVEAPKLWAYQAAPNGAGRVSTAPEPTSGEGFLVFAGAVPAAPCAPGDERDVLRLIETAGPGTAARYGLPERWSMSGRSPLADALSADRPLRLGSAEYAACHEDGPTAMCAGASPGALSLGAAGRRLGYLVVVGDAANGFGAGQRSFLERSADAIVAQLQAGDEPRRVAEPGPPTPSLLGPMSRRVVGDAGGGPGQVLSRVRWLTTAPANAMTVRDVGQVVVTALREPLGADRVALVELRTDRPVVAGGWEGRTHLWPAGSTLEPGLTGVGPGGLAVLSLPAPGRVAGACLIGWDDPHISGTRVALVIGDVQGHGAGAATIMGQMRTAVGAYAVEGHPPDVVVSHANRLLAGMDTDLFATCCYVELDLEEGNAWFVRAGHLAPLLRHPDGSADELMVEGGLPLGVLAEAEFPMTTAAPAPGTVLALLSDGLVESARRHLDEGVRRMCDALAAAPPADPGRMADVVLPAVSEPVTNALVHAHGTVHLELTAAADRLRVAVTDSSPRAPAKPVIVDWEATGGRSILMVEARSASWGSVPVGGGRQVWSEIVLLPREPRRGGPGSAEPGSSSGDVHPGEGGR